MTPTSRSPGATSGLKVPGRAGTSTIGAAGAFSDRAAASSTSAMRRAPSMSAVITAKGLAGRLFR